MTCIRTKYENIHQKGWVCQQCLALPSTASVEHSASVDCVVESWRHHRDTSAAPWQSAVLHRPYCAMSISLVYSSRVSLYPLLFIKIESIKSVLCCCRSDNDGIHTDLEWLNLKLFILCFSLYFALKQKNSKSDMNGSVLNTLKCKVGALRSCPH